MVAIFISAFAAAPTHAASAGSTGAAFLELGIGARQAGRGFADAAWAEDVYGVYFNPAGIAQMRRQELAFTHNTMFMDLNYNTLGFAYPFANNGTLALNGLYVDLGSVERREIAAGGGPTAVLGNANGWDFAFSGTYARTVTEFLDLGMTFKIINESLDNYSASAFAVDLGAKWRPPVPGFTVGLSLSNLGSRLKFVSAREELPITLRGGLGYRSENKRWGITGDVIYTKNQDLEGAIGGEVYVWPEHLCLRAGANSSADASNGFSLGAGFKWTDLTLDYAFIPFGELGNQNLFSLSYQFGAEREQPAVRRTPRVSRTEPAAQQPASTQQQQPAVLAQPATTQRPAQLVSAAAARAFRYDAGPTDYFWLAEATADVIAADWRSQGVSVDWESARFKLEGTCWVTGKTFFISAILKDDITGRVMMFNALGDADAPFEVWNSLQRKLNAHLYANGLNIAVPAPPVRRQAPLEAAPVRQAEPAYVPQQTYVPPVSQPTPVQQPVEEARRQGVTVAKIMEHGATEQTQLSSRITSAVESALQNAGILAEARTAEHRFEASYSALEDGTVVVYGRIIDRATGIPVGTVEIYGSSRNVDSLGERIADAVMVKLPR